MNRYFAFLAAWSVFWLFDLAVITIVRLPISFPEMAAIYVTSMAELYGVRVLLKRHLRAENP